MNVICIAMGVATVTVRASDLFRSIAVAATVLVAGMSAPAMATRTITGTSANGVSWTASNSIVGVTSSATVAGGGDPRYLAQTPMYRGVVGLTMEYSDGSAFVCSGSLLPDRASILTAGHCVSSGFGTAAPDRVTAFFYDGNSADPVYYNNFLFGGSSPGVTAVPVTNIFVNPGYTGEVIDQNDIAVLRLGSPVPDYAVAYQLYAGNDLTGKTYNIAGYGARSDGGGYVGDDLSPGRLRQGLNRYEYRLGDPDLAGFFTSADPADPTCVPSDNFFCGSATIDYSYISDFDNGLLRNDTGCLTSVFLVGTPITSKFCDQGLGAGEVSSAGGDSGGPEFIDGQIASVTSYGLSFGAFFGDSDGDLDSTFGEFNGFVPVSIHRDFIFASMVPEPASWATMIGGIGFMGGALRRRRRETARAVA